jgi:hypothetical protein
MTLWLQGAYRVPHHQDEAWRLSSKFFSTCAKPQTREKNFFIHLGVKPILGFINRSILRQWMNLSIFNATTFSIALATSFFKRCNLYRIVSHHFSVPCPSNSLISTNSQYWFENFTPVLKYSCHKQPQHTHKYLLTEMVMYNNVDLQLKVSESEKPFSSNWKVKLPII